MKEEVHTVGVKNKQFNEDKLKVFQRKTIQDKI